MIRHTILATLLPVAALAEALPGLDANGDPIPLATYTVDGEDLTTAADPAHLAQWERFREVIPSEHRTEIVEFQPINGATGIDGTVAPASDDRSRWLLMLDTTGETPQEDLERTMVHEFAHLLTLRLDQVPAGTEDGVCDAFYVSDGCMLDTSYLTAFGNAFWDGDSGEEWGSAEERYTPDAYVTEYAATNALEDIAESFAEFVVYPENWQGDSIADQKVQFFEDYPELMQLRDDIQDGLF